MDKGIVSYRIRPDVATFPEEEGVNVTPTMAGMAGTIQQFVPASKRGEYNAYRGLNIGYTWLEHWLITNSLDKSEEL